MVLTNPRPNNFNLPNSELTLSVIIPLFDDRQQARRVISSWTQKQTYDRHQYEVIVVTNNTKPQIEAQIKDLLVPHDSIIYCQSDIPYQYYDIGANRAKGNLLLFTELHVIAARKCIAEIVSFFDSQNYHAASCHSGFVSRNGIAKMEERYYLENINLQSPEEYWHKIQIRGLAIYRSLYLAEGGFEYDCGYFCERALAARLYSQNYTLGHIPKSIVGHYNSTTLKEVFQAQSDYGYGECHYRSKYSDDYCDRYFNTLPIWSNRWQYTRETAGLFCFSLLVSLFTGFKPTSISSKQFQLKSLAWYLIVFCLGLKLVLFQSRLKISKAYLQIWLRRFNPQKTYPIFLNYWCESVNFGRYQYIAQNCCHISIDSSASLSYNLAKIKSDRLTNFDRVETYEGRAFRWSQPIALIRVSLSPANYRGQIQILPNRCLKNDLDLQLFWNTNRITNIRQDSTRENIFFEIKQTVFDRNCEYDNLILTCNPLKPSQSGSSDSRLLGLAIRSINFKPLADKEAD